MSKNETIFTNCPVIKSDVQSLCERLNVGNGQHLIMAPFEKKIYWILESESEIHFYHGGQLLKKGSTYSDYYGFLKSATSAIEEAREQVKHYALDANSSLSIEVRTRIFHIPRIKESYMDSAFDPEKTFLPIPENAFWFEQSPVLSEYEQIMNKEDVSFEQRFHAYDKIEPLRIQTRVVEENLTIWSNSNDSMQTVHMLQRKYS